jgi:hypothetical protein
MPASHPHRRHNRGTKEDFPRDPNSLPVEFKNSTEKSLVFDPYQLSDPTKRGWILYGKNHKNSLQILGI